MYAIRSYYVPSSDAAAFEIRREDFELLAEASPELREAVGALAAERRITSYNVCYTKLLRDQDDASGEIEPQA